MTRSSPLPASPATPLRLSDLPNGAHATVQAVRAGDERADAQLLQRLGELGFLPGEPVQVLRRGPGGRDPIAVQVGETLFALRRVEAQCVEVVASKESA
jgi:ferrous iron transport protein A